MIDEFKNKIIEYKYQIIGFILLLLLSGIYKYYYPDLDKIVNQKEESKIILSDEIQNEIQNEIKSLKKKLLSTEKQLLKYKDELNNKKELSMYENSQYNFNRNNKKILILKWTAAASDKKTFIETGINGFGYLNNVIPEAYFIFRGFVVLGGDFAFPGGTR